MGSLASIAKKHKASRTGTGTALAPKAVVKSYGEWLKDGGTGGHAGYKAYVKATKEQNAKTPRKQAAADQAKPTEPPKPGE